MAAATVLTLANVQPEHVKWLWPGYIPAGKLTMFDGDPASGKSTMSLDLAARLTSGGVWPDGTPGTPGNVLLLAKTEWPTPSFLACWLPVPI